MLTYACCAAHHEQPTTAQVSSGTTAAAPATSSCCCLQFAAVAVLDVPFLDVLHTMRDPQLPLTIKERREWGDPLNDEVRIHARYTNIVVT
jgi:oligopeptidase B